MEGQGSYRRCSRARTVTHLLFSVGKGEDREETLTIAVIGADMFVSLPSFVVLNPHFYFYVRKSFLNNSRLKRAALPSYILLSREPSTNEILQVVALEVDSQRIVIIDSTPGISFVSDEGDDQSTEDLMLLYSLPAFKKGDTSASISSQE